MTEGGKASAHPSTGDATGSTIRRMAGVNAMRMASFGMAREYRSFAEFWPFYLSEHSQRATRVLHLIGTTLGIALIIYLIAIGKWWLFFLGFVPGYGFAWLAHFLVEKNRPATFKYPLWSFMGDYEMIALMLTRRLK